MSSPSSYHDDEEGPDDERLPPSLQQHQQQHQTSHHPSEDPVVVGKSAPTAVLCQDVQLVLLCLDYLRDLRRNLHAAATAGEEEKGNGPSTTTTTTTTTTLAGDYISIAIWALSRSFPQSHAHLCQDNDPWFRRPKNKKQPQQPPQNDSPQHANSNHPQLFALSPDISIPNVQEINLEIIQVSQDEGYSTTTTTDPVEETNPVRVMMEQNHTNKDRYHEEEEEHPYYVHEDLHASNGERFYPLGGLAPGPPLTLPEICMAGLSSLQSRSRGDVERNMIHHDVLFDQFVSAVRARGFFDNDHNDTHQKDHTTQDERYAKVVAKFRTKLATKAAADQQQQKQLLSSTHLAHANSNSSGMRRINLTKTAPAALTKMGPSMRKPKEDDRSIHRPKNMTVNTTSSNKDRNHNRPSPPPNIDIGPAHDRHLQRRRRTQRLESIRKGKQQQQQPQTDPAIASPSSLLLPSTTTTPPHTVPVSSLLSQPLSPQFRPPPPPPPSTPTRTQTAATKSNDSPSVESPSLSVKSPPAIPNPSLAYSTRHRDGREGRRFVNNEEEDHKSKPNDSPSVESPSLSVKSLSTSSAYSSRRRDGGEGGGRLVNNNEEGDHKSKPTDETSRRLGGGGTILTSHGHMNGNEGKNKVMVVTHNSKGNAAQEAERLKNVGNACMQKKEYRKAADCYTTAIRLCPSGPNSHVYYSNRAASLLSTKQYEKAIVDSETSLALKPDYGKAYARLGLAHLLLGHYQMAVDAYDVSLHYEPTNKSSINYLEKAKTKLKALNARPKTQHHYVPQSNTVHNTNGPSAYRDNPEDPFFTMDDTEDRSVISSSGVSIDLAGSSSSIEAQLVEGCSIRTTTNGDGGWGHDVAKWGPGPTMEGKLEEVQEEESEKEEDDDGRDHHHQVDNKSQEASRLKDVGNAYMQSGDYPLAIRTYTKALLLCPAGPSSHVYLSNRAAALCYLERYEEAETDSIMSLTLQPEYEKAHARLGLSRFFLGDYEGAVDAYTTALNYEPNNAASRSYLAKAKAKLEHVMDGGAALEDEEETVGETQIEEDNEPPEIPVVLPQTIVPKETLQPNVPKTELDATTDPINPPSDVSPSSLFGSSKKLSPTSGALPPRSPRSRASVSRAVPLIITTEYVMGEMERIAELSRSGVDTSPALKEMLKNKEVMEIAQKIIAAKSAGVIMTPKKNNIQASSLSDPSMMGVVETSGETGEI